MVDNGLMDMTNFQVSIHIWLPTDTRRDRKMYALHHDLKTGQLERW